MLLQSFIDSMPRTSELSDDRSLRRNDVDDLCQDTFLLAFTRLQLRRKCAVSYLDQSHRDQPMPASLRHGRQVSNGE